MRVLCTTIGSPSHGRAQLPLLRALSAAGHEVRVATTSHIAPLFADDDLTVDAVFPEFNARTILERADGLTRADLPEDPAELTQFMVKLMAGGLSGSLARSMHEILLPLVEEFRPSLMLRDGMDLSTCLIGERLGIPHLPTPSGLVNSFDPALFVPGLTTLRKELGLPADDDPLSVVAHGRVDYVPDAYSFALHVPPSLSYRQTVNVERSSVLPRWVAELPTDRPLVFAALGTALPMMHTQMEQREKDDWYPFPQPDPAATLQSIVRTGGLLEECEVIVATGGVPVDGSGLPPHVHLTERLPQPLLLEAADVFLTHGGFNSVRESLRTGTPIAVLPQFGDQHPNAQRATELGIGREITDRSPEGAAAVIRGLLADDGVAAAARRARLAMLALPEVDSAVADLEKLAG
ncbi:glycosyltransferase [Streptomyces sp. HNM0574]|uniref:glycosyltransferase n=1 Tax=Streptomyces sp. HNM0574 TaxID=2714954 RepID=UPI00146C09E3|nr:glycosyltransferase [Streptomyces sp. HNM0574]NLU70685.1 glycosyltransferase family 1 protein [Streptomyces sp. HNM0574]